MQIKITVRFNYTLMRRAQLKTNTHTHTHTHTHTNQTEYHQGCKGTGTSIQ